MTALRVPLTSCPAATGGRWPFVSGAAKQVPTPALPCSQASPTRRPLAHWPTIPQPQHTAPLLTCCCSCPVCNAPKRRFKAYAGAAGNKKNDQKSMNARWQKLQAGEGLDSAAEENGSSTGLIIGGVAGAVALAALYFYLSAQYN